MLDSVIIFFKDYKYGNDQTQKGAYQDRNQPANLQNQETKSEGTVPQHRDIRGTYDVVDKQSRSVFEDMFESFKTW